MIKWLNILKKFAYSMLLLCFSLGGYAQLDKLNRAQQLLQEKSVDIAKLTIDSVILNPETKGDFVSWTTRAYIYFEIYKRSEKLLLNSPLRDTIITSLKTSNALNPDETFKENNKKLLFNLAAGYHNLSKTFLNTIDYKSSLIAYNKFKEISSIIDPTANFEERDINYYLAVGSVYSQLFNTDTKNTEAQEIAKLALLKVLDIQPLDTSANFNLGVMYYNQAVNLVKGLDYGANITQIDIVQENIVKLAKQAEQLMVKVYRANNKSMKAVEALHSIYKMLNDKEKEQEFKIKCNELNIKLD